MVMSLTSLQNHSRLAAAASILMTSAALASGGPEIIAGPVEIINSTHKYYLLSPSTVDEAVSVAESLDGKLVVFESFAEQSAVVEALSMWNGVPRWCWIGLSDRVTDGDWRWATPTMCQRESMESTP